MNLKGRNDGTAYECYQIHFYVYADGGKPVDIVSLPYSKSLIHEVRDYERTHGVELKEI